MPVPLCCSSQPELARSFHRPAAGLSRWTFTLGDLQLLPKPNGSPQARTIGACAVAFRLAAVQRTFVPSHVFAHTSNDSNRFSCRVTMSAAWTCRLRLGDACRVPLTMKQVVGGPHRGPVNGSMLSAIFVCKRHRVSSHSAVARFAT